MKHKLNLFLFFLPLLALFALNIVLEKTETVSLREKRVIRSRPAFSVKLFFSGQYTRDYDDYYTDNFVFRDVLVEIGSAIKGLRGIHGDEGATLMVQKGNNMSERLTGTKPVSQSMPISDIRQETTAGVRGHSSDTVAMVEMQSGKEAVSSTDQDLLGGKSKLTREREPAKGGAAAPLEEETAGELHVANVSDTYLVLRDRALLLYKYSRQSAEAYAKAVNLLRRSVDPKIRMYDMLVPSQIEFLGIEKYRGLSDSQKEAFRQVNMLLDRAVIPVDAYGSLAAHKDEYVYLRTDHHWTALGAYYVYREFMKRVGEEPVALGRFRKEEIGGYLGTTYAATLKSSLKKHADTIELYMPFTTYEYTAYTAAGVPLNREVVDSASVNNRTPDYSVFLGGDFPWGIIKTEVQNNKRILVLKDSYANAFIPFLLPHYEEIYFIDSRHFKSNLLKFIRDKGITDVLILNGSFVTTYSGIADLMTEIMTK